MKVRFKMELEGLKKLLTGAKAKRAIIEATYPEISVLHQSKLVGPKRSSYH